MTLPGSRTNPSLVAARLLLKPGRKYEDAVKEYQPYDRVQEVNQDARVAAAVLLKERVESRSGETFVFVNNRLEGNALETIIAILALTE